MAQDTDESRATVVVEEPGAAAAVAVAAGRVVVIVQVVVGVELLARGQSQGNRSCDLLRVDSNDFEKKILKVVQAHPQQIT